MGEKDKLESENEGCEKVNSYLNKENKRLA